jgi:hypothetical protein
MLAALFLWQDMQQYAGKSPKVAAQTLAAAAAAAVAAYVAATAISGTLVALCLVSDMPSAAGN